MPPANPKNFTNAVASDLGIGMTGMDDDEEKKKKMLQQQQARGVTPMGYAAQELFPGGSGV